jgi:hypothetical protein
MMCFANGNAVEIASTSSMRDPNCPQSVPWLARMAEDGSLTVLRIWQERSGFHYHYSIYQVECSRNLIFQRGSQMEQIFQGLIDRTRADPWPETQSIAHPATIRILRLASKAESVRVPLCSLRRSGAVARS